MKLPSLQPWSDQAWSMLADGGRIVMVLALAMVLRYALHRMIDRVAEGIAEGRIGLGRWDGRWDDRLPTATAVLTTPLLSQRREQRARTTASLLRNVTTVGVLTMAALIVLQVLQVPIAPLLASAGVVGVALGLGAQAAVRDVIAGLFMIMEDQYGVGDVVDLGAASGLVESVGLRVTRLRDTDGTVWYLRNGEVQRVGNRSQGWARAVLDVAVAYEHDPRQVRDLLMEVAADLAADPQWAADALEPAEVWGMESLTADAFVLRLVLKTRPLRQWDVARELRNRIKARFDLAGVRLASALVEPAALTRSTTAGAHSPDHLSAEG